MNNLWKFIKRVIYDLFIAFVPPTVSNLFWQIVNLKTINLSFFFKYSFYFFWAGIFLLILILHFLVPIIFRKIIDKKQKKNLPSRVISTYDSKLKTDYKGFKWEVFFNSPSHVKPWELYKESNDYDLSELKGCHFGKVEGPYCPEDKREVIISRTIFGFYKYKCPKCGYEKKLSKNLYTFQEDILDEIRSKSR